MVTAVVYNKLDSVPYDNVYELMNDRLNIPDPKSRPTGKAFIFDLDPLMKGLGFAGLPYIVLELPTIDSVRASLNNKYDMMTWKHIITVRSARDGSSNTKIDVGRSDIQSISNSLFKMFNSHEIKQTLRDCGQERTNLKKISTDVVTIDQKQLYEAVFELKYTTRTSTDPTS